MLSNFNMPVLIIDGWEVSIRPCELNNFAKIFGSHLEIKSRTIEYRRLMEFLTKTGLNLVEFIEFADDDYQSIKNQITQGAKTAHFFDVLDKSRELTKSNNPGSNVIRYLLYRLNNKVTNNNIGLTVAIDYQICILTMDVFRLIKCHSILH